jgi:hypothetical protein
VGSFPFSDPVKAAFCKNAKCGAPSSVTTIELKVVGNWGWLMTKEEIQTELDTLAADWHKKITTARHYHGVVLIKVGNRNHRLARVSAHLSLAWQRFVRVAKF